MAATPTSGLGDRTFCGPRCPLPDCRTPHTRREAKRPFEVPRTHGRDMRFAPPRTVHCTECPSWNSPERASRYVQCYVESARSWYIAKPEMSDCVGHKSGIGVREVEQL